MTDPWAPCYDLPMSDHDPLREGCAFVERLADLVEMRGADRVRFLNGYLTCDTKPLALGEGTYGFVTEVKGHVLADVRVLAGEEALWLDLPAGKGEEVAAHLRKYVIVDRVEIDPLASWTAWTVAGPKAADVLAAGELPAYGHREMDLDGLAARLFREEDLDGVAVYTLWSEHAVADVLAARGGAVAPEDLERLRIEAGRPLFGRDFGPENFPQETGLDGAISYEKGCYLGQEVVARIHYRGGVNRQLRGLRLKEEVAVGGKVLHDGREAGILTSATDSPRYGAIGLAILHKRVEPGVSVEIEGGGTAVVCELPFAAG